MSTVYSGDDFICGCSLAVLIVSGLLDVDYFSGKLVWTWLRRQIVLQRWEAGLASRLVLSWYAPEAVVDLHSEGVVDFGTILDVIGLTGRRPGAAVCRVLQGRDV